METTELELEAVREMVIESVRASVANSFSTMAGIDAVVGPESCLRVPDVIGRSVAGVIGWSGRWNGTGILECTPEFACYLANLMLDTAATELNEDALDVIAEMANIIFGSMKTTLETSLGRMGLSTPTVIYGKEVGIYNSAETCTVLPVQIEQHSLRVKVFVPDINSKHHSFSPTWALAYACQR